MVEKLISTINKKYSSGYWKPIIYIDKKIEHKDLIAYYRMAGCSDNKLHLRRDEPGGQRVHVASQVDEKGMLILSELAGAAEELEALDTGEPIRHRKLSPNR